MSDADYIFATLLRYGKGMEISVKNHVDTMIFHTAICFRAKTNSFYGNREIAYANFSAHLRNKVAREWRLLWIKLRF